jgi:hypothetical protein
MSDTTTARFYWELALLRLGLIWLAIASSICLAARTLRDSLVTTRAWLGAVPKQSSSYFDAQGNHQIKGYQPGHIYVTPVPSSVQRYSSMHPRGRARFWNTPLEVAELALDLGVQVPEDRKDLVLVGEKIREGCHVKGGGYDCFVVEEYGFYLEPDAPISGYPDGKCVPFLKRDLYSLQYSGRVLAFVLNSHGEGEYVAFPQHLFEAPPVRVVFPQRPSLVEHNMDVELGVWAGPRRMSSDSGTGGVDLMRKALSFLEGDEEVDIEEEDIGEGSSSRMGNTQKSLGL